MNILDNSIVKQAAMYLFVAAVGFGSNKIVESVSQGRIVEQQAIEIKGLSDGQEKTHSDVQDLGIALARIEGKIDVLNQKVEDDRRPAAR